MDNQLRNQIQEEMDRDLLKERQIKNKLKRFLKNHKQFKLVDKEEYSDAVIIFNKNDIDRYNFALTNRENPFTYINPSMQHLLVIYYLKNKNTHDKHLASFGYIKKKR